MSLQLDKSFREILENANRPNVGIWVSSGSTLVTEICAGSGLDFLIIDMEHSPVSLETVLVQLQIISGYPITAIVRVPSNDPTIIKQVLDLGAQNILVPMVNTAADAMLAVEAVHYPPTGRRGVGAALARSARWNRVSNYLEIASKATSVFVQVETIEAIRNAQEISEVKGVDGVFIGPSDLAASMGLIGQQSHEDVIKSVIEGIKIVKNSNNYVGVNVFDPELGQKYLSYGIDFLLVSADVALLARSTEKLAEEWIPNSKNENHQSY